MPFEFPINFDELMESLKLWLNLVCGDICFVMSASDGRVFEYS